MKTRGLYRAAKIVETLPPGSLKMFHALSDGRVDLEESIFWHIIFLDRPDQYQDDNHRVIALLFAQLVFDDQAL